MTPPMAALLVDDRVHRDAYVNPEVFELELDRIYSRTWVYIGHESEVAEPGDYKTTEIGRVPIILSRGVDGSINAMENRCAHRGATVCQLEKGTAKFFRCSYHGWVYKNTGEHVGAGYRTGYPEDFFDPTEQGLRKVPRVESYRGLIFGSLAPQGESLDVHLGAVRPYLDLRLDAAPDGLALRSGSHRYTYAFNWKTQLENAVDGYHANFVHESMLSIMTKNRGGRASGIWKLAGGASLGVSRGFPGGHGVLDQRPSLGDKAVTALAARPGGADYLARLRDLHGPDRAAEIAKAGSGEGMNLAIFPNLVLVSQQLRVVRPRSVLRTDVELFPTWLDGAPDELNVDRLRQHELQYGPAGFIGPDDLEIFRRVSVGIGSEQDAWVDLRRGRFRSQHEEGIEIGHFTDETPQRAFWHEWLRQMTAVDGED